MSAKTQFSKKTSSSVRFLVIAEKLVHAQSSIEISHKEFFGPKKPELGDAKLWIVGDVCHIVLLNGSGAFRKNGIQGEKLEFKKNGALTVKSALGYEKNSKMPNEISI